jgi:DNA-binding response OmpR family regulator
MKFDLEFFRRWCWRENILYTTVAMRGYVRTGMEDEDYNCEVVILDEARQISGLNFGKRCGGQERISRVLPFTYLVYAKKRWHIMNNWILVIGYNRNDFEAAQREWLKYGVLLHMVDTIAEAVAQLPNCDYLAVAVSANTPDLSPPMQILRNIRPVPIVFLSPEDRAIERAVTLLSGADAFIDPSPPHLAESIAKSTELIGRYGPLPPKPPGPVHVLSYKDIFLAVDYHKAFVKGKEAHLSKNEMSALELLMTQVGRVFAYEQIYSHVYGEEAPFESIINAVQCQVKRLRRKLHTEPGIPNYIGAVRGIGYRIILH